MIENYKVGDLARYRLDYASLQSDKPRLVYCSITGFGQTGPVPQEARATTPSSRAWAASWPSPATPTASPAAARRRWASSSPDLMAGMYASVAILAALEHRDAVSGKGQRIDLALLELQVASLSHAAMGYLASGDPVPRSGTRVAHGRAVADGTTARRRDHAGSGQQGAVRSSRVLGRPDLPTDPRFVTNQDRIRHRAALNAVLASRSSWSRPKQHWIDALAAVGALRPGRTSSTRCSQTRRCASARWSMRVSASEACGSSARCWLTQQSGCPARRCSTACRRRIWASYTTDDVRLGPAGLRRDEAASPARAGRDLER